MPEEDFTPQKAMIHGISTLIAMEKRGILGVVCLKSFHKLYSHTWLGRPFIKKKKLMIIQLDLHFLKDFLQNFSVREY